MSSRPARILFVATGLLALLAAGCRRSFTPPSPTAPTPRWQALASGMELRVRGKDDLVAVRIDPSRCRVRVVDARVLTKRSAAFADEVCPPVGAAINGPFFAEDYSPIGLLIIDGQRVQRHDARRQWGVFRVRGGRPEILAADAAESAGVTQAVECRPRLVVHGRIPSFKPQAPARRSAVGLDARGGLLLAATGRYLTLEEWAAVLKDELGCVEALNLDGGPSTQLAVRGARSATVQSISPVPVFLTIAPR